MNITKNEQVEYVPRLNVLVAGESKVGKTTVTVTAPKPILRFNSVLEGTDAETSISGVPGWMSYNFSDWHEAVALAMCLYPKGSKLPKTSDPLMNSDAVRWLDSKEADGIRADIADFNPQTVVLDSLTSASEMGLAYARELVGDSWKQYGALSKWSVTLINLLMKAPNINHRIYTGLLRRTEDERTKCVDYRPWLDGQESSKRILPKVSTIAVITGPEWAKDRNRWFVIESGREGLFAGMRIPFHIQKQLQYDPDLPGLFPAHFEMFLAALSGDDPRKLLEKSKPRKAVGDKKAAPAKDKPPAKKPAAKKPAAAKKPTAAKGGK